MTKKKSSKSKQSKQTPETRSEETKKPVLRPALGELRAHFKHQEVKNADPRSLKRMENAFLELAEVIYMNVDDDELLMENLCELRGFMTKTLNIAKSE